MPPEIEKATATGFCFGVKRAINILEKVARERGQIETLGAIVHNQQVLQRLAGLGVRTANGMEDIEGDTVVIGAHGIGPQQEEALRARFKEIINTTCPFVHRAQIAARRLARAGFFVIVYGDANHPEVRGILDWASGKGVSTVDTGTITALEALPRRLGILSQTTQVPANFNEFVKKLIDIALVKDAELRITDTICHDIRERQQSALELARKADLMLVIGSRTSANTKHLAELCGTATETYLIETADEIMPAWLDRHHHIGITSGASTAEETINEVLARLKAMGS